MNTGKPHIVLIPYPEQGHINPTTKLAKLFHTKGFHITLVNTELNHNLLIRSKEHDHLQNLPDFRFEKIPDAIPPPDWDPMLIKHDAPSKRFVNPKACLVHSKELVLRLNMTSDLPRVSCIVVDAAFCFGVQVWKELGIPEVCLWTGSACSFLAFLHYPDFISRGIFPFKDESYLTDGTLEKPIDWITGMSCIRYRDVPTFIRTTNPKDIKFHYMKEAAQKCLESSALIFNTFDALENKVLEAIKSKFKYHNIYTIGPLPLLEKSILKNSSLKSLDSHLWKPDSKCLEWLDKRGAESVIYVNFGSIMTPSDQLMKELAWGLANSEHPFLWVIRHDDITRGDSRKLLEGFWEEINDRGLIVSWCSQDQVLAHPSIGAFLTHCGWNSTLESVSEGVPTICLPFVSDQLTHSRYLCTEWGMGMDISQDVKREQVEILVKEMLAGEKGKLKRIKAKEWKLKAKEATDENVQGSSYVNFKRFIKEALHHE